MSLTATTAAAQCPAAAMALVNSAGVVPVSYFVCGDVGSPVRPPPGKRRSSRRERRIGFPFVSWRGPTELVITVVFAPERMMQARDNKQVQPYRIVRFCTAA